MRLYAKLAAPALFFALSAAAANAAPVDLFSFSSAQIPGGVTASISSSPVPTSFVPGVSFTLAAITATVSGTPETGDVTFLLAGGAAGGGSTFGGDTLFSGLVSSPTFLLGTFSLSGMADLGNGLQQVSGRLTISQASPVPEPFTLGLTGTGVLALVEMLRRRRVQVDSSEPIC